MALTLDYLATEWRQQVAHGITRRGLPAFTPKSLGRERFPRSKPCAVELGQTVAHEISHGLPVVGETKP